MLKSIRLQKLGGSVAVILPKPLLDRLHLAAGDEVHVIETPDGLLLSPFDRVFADAMGIYERGVRKYRNALRELDR